MSWGPRPGGGGGTTDNVSEGFIPLKQGGEFVDSPMRYDDLVDEVISTSAGRYPGGTVYIGPQMGIDDGGQALIYRLLSDDITRICLTVGFDDTGTVQEPFTTSFNAKEVRFVVQPDDSSEVIATSFTETLTGSADEFISKIYGKIGTVAPVDDVNIKIYFDTIDPNNLFVDQTFPAGDFAVGTEFELDLQPIVGQFEGQTTVTVISSDTAFAVKHNAAQTAAWTAVDRQTGDFIKLINENDFNNNLAGTLNTVPFNPTEDYHPATRKFVLDNITATLNYKGGYDAANNIPDLDVSPSGVMLGDFYTVTSNGTFFTASVSIGDAIIAEIDNASTEADWTILNRNLDAVTIKMLYESNPDTNAYTDAEKVKVGNLSGVNTGDQDLSGLALKSNVLELDNTTVFTPDADYEPATKKYVDDNAGGDLKVYYAESLAESNTSSSWVNKVTLNLPSGFEAGDYFIEVNYGWRMNATDEKYQSRVQLDSSDLGTYNHYQEPQDSNNRQVAFRRFKRTMTAGVHTIELDYGDATGGTAYIWDASITVTKIDIL